MIFKHYIYNRFKNLLFKNNNMKEFIDNFEVDTNKLAQNVTLKRKAKKQLDDNKELVNFNNI